MPTAEQQFAAVGARHHPTLYRKPLQASQTPSAEQQLSAGVPGHLQAQPVQINAPPAPPGEVQAPAPQALPEGAGPGFQVPEGTDGYRW